MYLFVDKFAPAVNPAYLQLRPQAIATMKAASGFPRILALGPDPIHRMAPNTPMLVGLEDVQGSDSLEVGAYRRLLGQATTAALGFPQPDPALPLMDLFGVRFVHSAAALEGLDKLKLISDYDGFLYENTRALPRAFAVPRLRVVSPEQALRAVAAADFQPAREALLSGEPGRLSSAPQPRPLARVAMVQHRPNSVLLTGDFAPGQIVMLADTYYPGWRAYLGAQELPILRADYALRAVEIPGAGKALRLLFVPASFWVGGFLGMLAAAVLAALGAAAWVRGRWRE